MAGLHRCVYQERGTSVTLGFMILLVQGHPASESLSDALSDAYAEGAATRGASVERLVLRNLTFDPNLSAGFSGRQELEPDLDGARAAIERAAHVAWFFPTWWAGPPALVKGFVDRTFLPGWAFAYHKRSSLPEALLRGRSARVVTTMDSPSVWYWLWHRGSVHASMVNATLRFVGFGPVRSSTFYLTRERSHSLIERWLERTRRLGEEDARRVLARATGPGGFTAAPSP